jgi:hypothetical protein
MANPDHEAIYIQPICPACEAFLDPPLWSELEDDAICPTPDCPLKPIKYIRADLWDDQIETITELVIADQMMEMSKLLDENRRLKAELDRLKADIETPRERRGFS